MTHVPQTRSTQIQADTQAALEALTLGLAGAVGFYAGLDRSRWGLEGPLDRAADMRGPLLGLFGGADQSIAQEQIDEFSRRLAEAGVEHDFHVYPGAPHSFFDRRQEEFAEASADAWRRVLGFAASAGERS